MEDLFYLKEMKNKAAALLRRWKMKYAKEKYP